jgi:hypothetical protein
VSFAIRWLPSFSPRQDREDRSKNLLARDRHAVLHAGKHRRLHIEAGPEPVGSADTAGDARRLVDAFLNQSLNLVELNLADDFGRA